jgi:hypothetical protein
MSRRWEVRDPDGFRHTVEEDDKGIMWGTENLANYSDVQNLRGFIVANVLQRIKAEPEMGEYSRFAWIKL